MNKLERVVENLNAALHQVFAADEHVFLLGEDILDPYGGAFKVSKGLSTCFPDRIYTTPLSEAAILGIANGLALSGEKAIVEIMFGDFISLAFDQIVNFAAKSVAMYGQKLPFHLLVRCPVGGNRGYGPTHSQSMQKHFIGVPHLTLCEISPFHDNRFHLPTLLNTGTPAILFEDKVLYAQKMYQNGVIDDLFGYDFVDTGRNYARIALLDIQDYDCIFIAPGGLATRALQAMRDLFLHFEIHPLLLVPFQLYPFHIDPLLPLLAKNKHIFVLDEGTPGGSWASEVAQTIYERLWGVLTNKVRLIHSQASIIPSSLHLEKQIIVQASDIYQAAKEEMTHA